jgi:hypothetical protein
MDVDNLKSRVDHPNASNACPEVFQNFRTLVLGAVGRACHLDSEVGYHGTCIDIGFLKRILVRLRITKERDVRSSVPAWILREGQAHKEFDIHFAELIGLRECA